MCIPSVSKGWGKVLFSQVCVCPHLRGTPVSGPRSLPILWSQSISVCVCVWGGVVIQSQLGGGVPQCKVGYSSPRGCPPSQDRTGVHPLPPETEQQSKYLLCGGRYCSCVHAGGLSCFFKF